MNSNMAGTPAGGDSTPKSARSRGAISLVNKKVKESLAALQPEANVQMLLNFKAFACPVRTIFNVLFNIT